MKEETKDKIKDAVQDVAEDAADKLRDKVESSTGLMRWVYIFLLLLALGASAFLATGCGAVPRVQLSPEQVQRAEVIYTALGGEVRYRVVPVEPVKK